MLPAPEAGNRAKEESVSCLVRNTILSITRSAVPPVQPLICTVTTCRANSSSCAQHFIKPLRLLLGGKCHWAILCKSSQPQFHAKPTRLMLISLPIFWGTSLNNAYKPPAFSKPRIWVDRIPNYSGVSQINSVLLSASSTCRPCTIVCPASIPHRTVFSTFNISLTTS